MPIERKFAEGSVIYFEHERAQTLYVLKSGQVDIEYIQPETGHKITKTLNQGEFFGLKSAIVNHTRNESAMAVTNVVTIEFKVSEFENYVGTNVELMKRLLRVLSNQLRNLGIKVNNYLGNNVLYPPNIGLFKIGEYYLNNKKYDQAKQVYERYIEQYSHTNLATEAQFRIELCDEALKTGMAKSFRPVDEIIGEGGNAGMAPSDSGGSLENEHSALGLKAVMDSFHKAESFFKSEEYVKALEQLKSFFMRDTSNASPKMVKSAKLMNIETLFHLSKYDECIDNARSFITTLDTKNDSGLIKQIYLIMAMVYEQTGKTLKRTEVLKKVATTPPPDEYSKKAKAILQEIGA